MLEERGSLGDGELRLPESLQGIIAARLDALSAEEKALVQDAAVMGKVFWPGALAALGGRERWALEEALHVLERKQFVRRERRSSVAGETQYAFLHLLVRDVAYGQIPRAQRAEKHRLAAEWIESLASDRSEDRAEMLAHHYLAALELVGAAGVDTAALAAPAARRASRGRRPRAGAQRLRRRRALLRRRARPRLEGRSRCARLSLCKLAQAPRSSSASPTSTRSVEAVAGFLAAGDIEDAAEVEAYIAVSPLERRASRRRRRASRTRLRARRGRPALSGEGARPGRALEVPDAGRATTRARFGPVRRSSPWRRSWASTTSAPPS